MTQSPQSRKAALQVARHALEIARHSFPSHSAPQKPTRFSQEQLFAIAALRQFFRTDFRGIAAILDARRDLCEVLGLDRAPHFSPLFDGEQRLFQGGVRALVRAA